MSVNNYKILMVSKNIPSTYKGGIQTHTYELSKSLVNNGHEVSILMSGSLFKKHETKNENGVNTIKIGYLPGRYIPILRLFLDELFFNIAAYFWLLKNSYKYDLIHLQGRSGFIYSIFPKKTPFVSTYHGLVSKEQKSIKASNLSLQYKLYYTISKKIESISLKRTKNLIVVSDSLKNDIIDLTKRDHNFTTISNGVNIPNFPRENTNKMTLITFIGRVEKTKGIQDLISAIENIESNIKCVIIGDGEYNNELTEKVNSNPKLKNKIWQLGSLDSDWVSKWINISSVVVLPSYYETQGIVLLEANAHAKPVIATNINGINEIVKNGVNGLLFEKGNIKDLINKIKIFIDNRKYAEDIGENGYNMVKKSYAWSAIVNQTEIVYKNILR